ncbi:hypothetical protein QJS10_CPB15g01697 [Acorus calamus]|uniref:Uncharacterized protein n=1 Tax=Acorus calamus TaxID=4465 RepID=A0AAV9D7N8_ACOCL|nr:hypothetical protein QJS10_CPB15g01697 [Acorus calamus]
MPTSYDKGIVDDLHSTSLYFRLRRQHGFAASQSMFDGFKDQSGAFMENLSMDMKGMLSLYEASHFAFEGEESMNHARAFTTKCLESVTGHLQMEPQVTHTLELPLCQWMQRLEARWYIDYLHDKRGEINPALLEFAKLDFNMSMNVHQSELKELSGWWIDLGLARKLSFVRDRLVESFFCAAAILPELQFGNGRKALTKVAAMIITLDDLYDVYGLLDELELFTNVVERWDINAMEQLPENMKICALALENITNEIARDIMREEGWDALPYLRCEWVKLCKSFLVEARWHAKGQLPTLEEYLQNAWISSSGPVLLIYSFFLSRQKITPELIDCIIASPDIIRSASMVFRLCNDLVTGKAELERGDAPTSIHCYMHGAGVSEAMACEHIKKLIDLEWKAMNEQSFVLSPFSKEFNVICMNLARMSHCLYNHGDGIGSPGKRAADNVSSLLMEPVGSKKI